MKKEEVKVGDQLIARIVHNCNKSGIHFFTPDTAYLQTAYMQHPKGYVVDAHIHKPQDRFVDITQEVFFVKSGRIKLKLYDDNKRFIKDVIIGKYSLVVIFSGGHALEFLTKSEIYEVKQGPYRGEDKIRFDMGGEA